MQYVRHLHISGDALAKEAEFQIARDLGNKLHSLTRLASITIVVRPCSHQGEFLAALIRSGEEAGGLPEQLDLRVVNFSITAGVRQLLPMLQETPITALECRGIVMGRVTAASAGALVLKDISDSIVSLHLATRIFDHVAPATPDPLRLRHLSIECRSTMFSKAVQLLAQCKATLRTGAIHISDNDEPDMPSATASITFNHLTALELSVEALPFLALADFPVLDSIAIVDDRVLLALISLPDAIKFDRCPALSEISVRSATSTAKGVIAEWEELDDFVLGFLGGFSHFREVITGKGVSLPLDLCLPANLPCSMPLGSLHEYLSPNLVGLDLVILGAEEPFKPCLPSTVLPHLTHFRVQSTYSSGDPRPASTLYGANVPCVQLRALLSSIKSGSLRTIQLHSSLNAFDAATVDAISDLVRTGSRYPNLQEIGGTVRLDGRTCKDTRTPRRLKAACSKSSVNSTALAILDFDTEENLS